MSMTHESRGLRGRVLVVDDDPDIRTILEDFLTIQGFVVRTAPDGRAALALFQAEPFDALLIDLNMPGMSGLEVAMAIRREGSTVPLALMTGSSHMLSRPDLTQAGLHQLFDKPFDLNAIAAWLASIMA